MYLLAPHKAVYLKLCFRLKNKVKMGSIYVCVKSGSLRANVNSTWCGGSGVSWSVVSLSWLDLHNNWVPPPSRGGGQKGGRPATVVSRRDTVHQFKDSFYLNFSNKGDVLLRIH